MNEGDIAVIPPDIPHKTAYLAEEIKDYAQNFPQTTTACYFHVRK